MSEVEKMYKNARVKKLTLDCYYNQPFCCKRCKHYKDNENCEYQVVKETYPSFTAEKQLSLIKWLFEISDISNINIECENNKICIHNILGQSDDCDTIEDALASYINDIWQDLTEQERTEITEILKG